MTITNNVNQHILLLLFDCPLQLQGNAACTLLYMLDNVTSLLRVLFCPFYRGELFERASVRGSQFQQPLMEFSGACEGCGETPYVKLLTQLFGERMIIANATGCSSIWGGSAPANPYTVNQDGRGPAWANSLFEDNAQFGFGISMGVKQRREALVAQVKAMVANGVGSQPLREAFEEWTKVGIYPY